ncbi:hypothetical protein XELAEV_18012570mg [Xenopus laevis]|uniref:Uncharacterized protein n=1 Tax=Xenopus laevis TaxID=8355 RepID=A0A974DQK0_XENLA|nr:hypothetical protein XELAEV_18012570mg [Xenopus laevis]
MFINYCYHKVPNTSCLVERFTLRSGLIFRYQSLISLSVVSMYIVLACCAGGLIIIYTNKGDRIKIGSQTHKSLQSKGLQLADLTLHLLGIHCL